MAYLLGAMTEFRPFHVTFAIALIYLLIILTICDSFAERISGLGVCQQQLGRMLCLTLRLRLY